MEIIRFSNGMTVADLKRIVAEWPETAEDGEPCKVWLSDVSGTSNPVHEARPLDKRQSQDGTRHWADLLLQHKKEV